MKRARQISLAVAIALVVVGGDAASASAATREYSGAPQAAFYAVARQANDDSKIRIVASIHDLEAQHDYVLVGSRRRCPNAGEPGGRVFRAGIETDANRDDLFTRGRVAARKPLRKMRSVLLYERGAAAPGQELACAARIKPPADGMTARTCGRLGGLLGCVSAAQAADSNTIDVVASLHGLRIRKQYILVGSDQPCSEEHTDDDQVFRLTLNTADGGDNKFGARSVKADAPLGEARSVRLFRLDAPDRTLNFCEDWTSEDR